MKINSESMSKGENQKEEGKRLFVLRGVLWYIFKNMENVVNNIGDLVNDNDLLLVSQNFFPPESEFVGKEVIPNPEAMITWFGKYFVPLKTICLKNYLPEDKVDWFIGIFGRKA